MSKNCAVILAAGEGKRMKANKPKPMMEVLDRPMIDWVLDAVDASGVKDTILVVGALDDAAVAEGFVEAGRDDRDGVAVRFVEGEALRDGGGVHEGRVAVQDEDVLRVGGVQVVEGHHDGVAGAEALFLLRVFREDPRLGLVDVLVGTLRDAEDRVHRVCHVVGGDEVIDLLHGVQTGLREVVVDGLFDRRRLDDTVEVLVRHGDGAVDEVADGVGKVGVVPLDHRLIGDGAVRCVGHLGQEIVPGGVDAEERREVIGIDDVATGLGHLVLTEEQPRVAVDLLRKRLTEGHQHDGPVDGVETDDILADQM